MQEQYFRTRLALSNDKVFEEIQQTSVMIVGVGGVGSFAAEALARMGIGTLILIDKDTISTSNLNRQLHATYETVGQVKVDVMKKRIQTINSSCIVHAQHLFLTEETIEDLFETYTPMYVIDASDTLRFKLHIITTCRTRNIPYITVLGMANKWNPTSVEVTTLDKTYNDPVARFMRSKLKKQGISLRKIPVVFSGELPVKPDYERFSQELESEGTRKEIHPPASNVFVPSVAGLVAAHFVIESIRKKY